MTEYGRALVSINRAYENEDYDRYENASPVPLHDSASWNGKSRTTPRT